VGVYFSFFKIVEYVVFKFEYLAKYCVSLGIYNVSLVYGVFFSIFKIMVTIGKFETPPFIFRLLKTLGNLKGAIGLTKSIYMSIRKNSRNLSKLVANTVKTLFS
jgi:hypothetical protein